MPAIATDVCLSVCLSVGEALCPASGRDKINDYCSRSSTARPRRRPLRVALIRPLADSARAGLIATPIKVVPTYGEAVMRLLMNWYGVECW